MANLAITPANVISSIPPASLSQFVAGAAINAGQIVYLDANGKVQLAVANGAPPANSVKGIAASSAAAGQPIFVCTKDAALAIGAGTAGEVLILSDTAGALAPAADAASGMFVTFLGVGVGGGVINFNPVASGVAVP